jgi:tol-pal system protein YbgF
MMARFTIAGLAFACSVLAVAPAIAQTTGELYVKVDQLENQVRQLTGAIEQLQYRNQQLEASLRRLQEEFESRPGGAPRVAAQAIPLRPAVQPLAPVPGQRRSDAFDPSQSPGAPGAPRTLGAVPNIMAPEQTPAEPMPPPSGRVAGAPLDLGSMSAAGGQPPASASRAPVPRPPGAAVSSLGAPPSALPSAPLAEPTLPPSQAPRDIYDLGYGYFLHKDYALAEDTFRDFLRRYPSDRLAAEAHYWLGETMFQRQNYRDAADAFLALSKKYETSTKAPDALLRLGQSLAALNEKELACATFGEVTRKYPRASITVKQVVDREQKRVHC